MNDSPLRVFHIVTHFDLGGAERVALNIAESVSPGVECHLVEVVRAHSAYTPQFINEMREHGIYYHRAFVPQYSFHYLFERLAAVTFPLWFVFLFLRYRPRVIHCHTEVPDMAVYAFASLFPWLMRRCRLVRTIHNTRLWTGLTKTGQRIERFMQQHHANVAISQSVRRAYGRRYGSEPEIIYNGVRAEKQKAYEGLVEGKVNILFAGRLEQQKGIDVLVRTVKVLENDGRFFFHIFGSGRLETFVRERLSGCKNCRVTGPLFGLSHYLGSFDFLFMPSLHEGLSMLSMEASMNGLPVVESGCEGLAETLPPGWPLESKANAPEDYAECFALPQEERRVLAEKARNFAEEHFTVARMGQCYEELYKSCLVNLNND